MYGRCTTHPRAYKDAVFLSPHKFVGGPGTPGVLVVRRDLLRNRVPTVPGGGTVDYVNPYEHHYIADPAHREEGGTPAIVESIRAGLVFGLKQAVGTDVIRAHEERFLRRRGATAGSATRTCRSSATSPPTGCRSCPLWSNDRAGCTCTTTSWSPLLHDLFGIQSRGGCSCAGPYGHRLLGIDLDRSHRFEQEIVAGCEGIKPGLGTGQLQLLHLRRHLPLHRGRGRPGRDPRLAAAARVPLQPDHRAVAPPGRPGRATDAPVPAVATTPTDACAPRPGSNGPRSPRSPTTWPRPGNCSPSWPISPRSRPRAVAPGRGCRPGSRSCAGSTSPTSASPAPDPHLPRSWAYRHDRGDHGRPTS